MNTLLLVPFAFMYLQAWEIKLQQAYFIFRPVLALTIKKEYPSSFFSLSIIFCAQGEGSFFKSALFPINILGTEGSNISFTCSIQYSNAFNDVSSARENTMNTPSDPLKKFLATERYLSCPEVSQSSTSTSSPSIFLIWLLQSAPMVLVIPILKVPQMMRSRMLVFPTEVSPMRQVLIFLPIDYINRQFLILILFMHRNKHKFYQLSDREREGEKMSDIYKLISQQQETMALLLSKYQDKDSREGQCQQQSRTIQTSSFQQTATIKRGRPSTKIEHITLQLPTISPNRGINKKPSLNKSRSKDNLNDLNPYFDRIKTEKEKVHLRNHLQRAYGSDKNKKNRSISRVQTIQKQEIQPVKKLQSERIPKPRQQPSLRQKQQTNQLNDLPTPLGYFKENVQDDSSSEQGEVPLNYYQREFRATIRSQCLQQTNFLYFSKNESIKDWTEGLLLLFEKHDKQLHSLRKKCKYLQKFDDNFFSIDIFKEG